MTFLPVMQGHFSIFAGLYGFCCVAQRSKRKKPVIKFSKTVLDNGLRVIVHEEKGTPLVAFNVLYDVGSKDESPGRTGFAHLFEHLMFGGSANIPDFDTPVQNAGGENNAFTNSDVTNFYEVLPANNLEVAMWLESDRMNCLNFSQEVLDVQKRVVVEEFKETCLNEPYGDVWHHISELAYKVHPYQWPTIGKVPEHVEQATLDEVKEFFYRHYRPNNAIVVISGNVREAQVLPLVEKWFGDIPPGPLRKRQLPAEPPQTEMRSKVIDNAPVPMDSIYLAFRMCGRTDADYYTTDLLSDVLSNGASSRFYQRLLKDRQLFSAIDCYISGTIDPGLFIIEGKPAEGISLEEAEDAIWSELALVRNELVKEEELQKVKNKVESSLLFSEISVLNKAINLAFFELLGDADLINQEIDAYRQVQQKDILRVANDILRKENCCRLIYRTNEELKN